MRGQGQASGGTGAHSAAAAAVLALARFVVVADDLVMMVRTGTIAVGIDDVGRMLVRLMLSLRAQRPTEHRRPTGKRHRKAQYERQ